jgi:hypothetical protein
MPSQIFVGIDFPGIHCWPKAPEHRKALRDPHGHDFRIVAWQGVVGLDREVEFFDLRGTLRAEVRHIAPDGNFGCMSCEQIAEAILHRIPELSAVSVAEDPNVGAVMSRWETGSVPLGRPKVITVCGSTKFADETRKVIAGLEMEGLAVFSVGFFAHAEKVVLTADEKERLDALHLAKIRLSDEIVVVNVGGYVGQSTAREIALAKRLGKGIRWLVEPEAGPC